MDDFKFYTNLLFLLFDIENKLDIKIREKLFSACFSNELYIEIKGCRYYVPFCVKYNKRKIQYDDYDDVLGFKPAFDIQLGKRKLMEMELFDSTEYMLDCKSIVSAVKDDLKRISGEVTTSDNVDDTVKEMIKKFGIEYRDADGNLIIESMKLIITSKSLLLLSSDYDNYDVIHADCKYFCSSVNNERKVGQVASIGYYIRKKGSIIEQYPQHHIAIIRDTNEDDHKTDANITIVDMM